MRIDGVRQYDRVVVEEEEELTASMPERQIVRGRVVTVHLVREEHHIGKLLAHHVAAAVGRRVVDNDDLVAFTRRIRVNRPETIIKKPGRIICGDDDRHHDRTSFERLVLRAFFPALSASSTRDGTQVVALKVFALDRPTPHATYPPPFERSNAQQASPIAPIAAVRGKSSDRLWGPWPAWEMLRLPPGETAFGSHTLCHSSSEGSMIGALHRQGHWVHDSGSRPTGIADYPQPPLIFPDSPGDGELRASCLIPLSSTA